MDSSLSGNLLKFGNQFWTRIAPNGSAVSGVPERKRGMT